MIGIRKASARQWRRGQLLLAGLLLTVGILPEMAAEPALAQNAGGEKPAPPGPPADLDAAIRQAQSARQGGDLAAAAKTLSQLVLFAPDDPRVLAEYGKTLAAEGRSDDALAFLERALQLQPGDWTLWSAQGVAFDQKANYTAAQSAYGRALALKPGEPAVLNNDALSHMQSGDLDGAEKLLRQAATGGAALPRIAQNLALVESLKTAHGAKAVEAAAATAPASPAPAPAAAPIQRAALAAPHPHPGNITHPGNDPTIVMQRLPPEEPPKPAIAQARPAPPPKSPPPRKKAVAESAAPAKKPEPPLLASAFYVQAGSYDTAWQAAQGAAALNLLGARVTPSTANGHAVYRVRIGPFLDVRQADSAIVQAQALGRKDAVIVSE